MQNMRNMADTDTPDNSNQLKLNLKNFHIVPMKTPSLVKPIYIYFLVVIHLCILQRLQIIIEHWMSHNRQMRSIWNTSKVLKNKRKKKQKTPNA